MNWLARAPFALSLCLPLLPTACGGDKTADPAPPPAAATTPSTPQNANPPAPSSELCRYGARRKPVLLGHVFKDGIEYDGDVPGKEMSEWPSRIPSAIAKPVHDTFSFRVAKDCYNAQGRYWYACPQMVEIKLGDIRGMSRGYTYEMAGALALRLCDMQVTERAKEAYGQTLDAQGLRCEVVEREYCRLPVPPTPPAKDPPKKK